MSNWTGSFNKSGSPTLKITLAGALPGSGIEFDAIVDTGFTGFIQMPAVKAFPLGLILAGTTDVILAGGTTAPRLMAFGTAKVGTEAQAGLILLSSGGVSDVLAGMEFIKAFGKVLLVHPTQQLTALVDETDIDEFFKAIKEVIEHVKATAAAKATATPAPQEAAVEPQLANPPKNSN